jgi:hypothetical protein
MGVLHQVNMVEKKRYNEEQGNAQDECNNTCSNSSTHQVLKQ